MCIRDRIEAANSVTNASSGSSGGSGGGSNGGSSSANTTSTPSQGYHVVHKLGKAFNTQGEASSKIGLYGGNGVYKDEEDGKWYVYKRESYSSNKFSSYKAAKNSSTYDNVAPWIRGIAKYAKGTSNARKGLNLISEDEYGDEIILKNLSLIHI